MGVQVTKPKSSICGSWKSSNCMVSMWGLKDLKIQMKIVMIMSYLIIN